MSVQVWRKDSAWVSERQSLRRVLLLRDISGFAKTSIGI